MGRHTRQRDPRVALSLVSVDSPFQPVIVRGRVIEWLEGDAAWPIIDELAAKYIGQPYSRAEPRIDDMFALGFLARGQVLRDGKDNGELAIQAVDTISTTFMTRSSVPSDALIWFMT